MSRVAFALLSLLAATCQGATALTKQKFFETFSYPDNSTDVPAQLPDNLPGPVNALRWGNLNSDFQIDRFNGGPLVGVINYDPYFYGGFVNISKPAVITSKYGGSCVNSWELDSFAFGCNARQMFYDPFSAANYTLTLASNCTVTVEGLDRKGDCVGREVFHYEPFPLSVNDIGYPLGFMTLFNTTKGGLKGVKLEKVKIGVKLVDRKDDMYTYEGGLGAGIDAVSYTVFNRTGCV